MAKKIRKLKATRADYKFHRLRSSAIVIPSTNRDDSLAIKRRRWMLEEELLRSCISEGMSREEQRNIMGMTEHQVAIVEKRLMANEGQRHLNKSTALRYYEYTVQQEQCARDLEYIVRLLIDEMDGWHKTFMSSLNTDESKLPPRPSMQAAVMAIKAKSEIYDKSVRLGQDMGIIEKRAKELRVSGNLNLAALPTEELKVLLAQKLSDFNKLVDRGELPNAYQQMIMRQRSLEHAKKQYGASGGNTDMETGGMETT